MVPTSSTTTMVQWYTPSASTTVTMPIYGGGTGYVVVANNGPSSVVPIYKTVKVKAPIKLLPGTTYEMPNGSKVIIDRNGGYRIDDKNARVLYRAANVREFNQFLNASDLIVDYINELVPLGVRQDEVLHLEIEQFIFWLIHRAAEKDNDPAPVDIPRLPSISRFVARRYIRCANCGRFISRAFARAQIMFCSADHMSKSLEKLNFKQKELAL